MASIRTWAAFPPNNSQPRIKFFIAVSVMMGLMICPFSLWISWAVFGSTASLVYGWSAGVVVFAISAFATWKVVLAPEFKRHAIELHEDRIVLDCKGTTSEMSFDDVWEFKVAISDEWNSRLTIKSRKRKLEFPINIEEADDFATRLLQLCPQALYQDAKGEVHSPSVTEGPERVWKVKQWNMIRRAIACLVGGTYFSVILIGMLHSLFETGSLIPEGSGFPTKLIWLPFIGPFALGYGIFLVPKAIYNGIKFKTLRALNDTEGLNQFLGQTELSNHASS